MFKMKNAWIEYRQEANQLKRYEKKIKKTQKLYAEYLEQANRVFVNPDKCDMHCGHTCVRDRIGINDIVNCMSNQCGCEFLVNAEQIIEMHKNLSLPV